MISASLLFTLTHMARGKTTLGIDIGGTKVAACVYGPTFKAFKQVTFPTAAITRNGKVSLPLLKEQLAGLLTFPIEVVGLGIKGVVVKGELKYSSLLGGSVRFDFRKYLSKILGLPVAVVNDVEAMAVAEKEFGFGRRYKNFTLVNLGTGIRVLHVAGSYYLTGMHGIAGEVSQVTQLKLRSRPKNNFGTIFIKGVMQLLTLVHLCYDPDLIVLTGGVVADARFPYREIVKNCELGSRTPTRGAQVKLSKVVNSGCLGAALVANR